MANAITQGVRGGITVAVFSSKTLSWLIKNKSLKNHDF